MYFIRTGAAAGGTDSGPTPPKPLPPKPVKPPDMPKPEEPERPPVPAEETPDEPTPDDPEKPTTPTNPGQTTSTDPPPLDDPPPQDDPPPLDDPPGDDDPPKTEETPVEDKPVAKVCGLTSMVLSKTGTTHKPKATKPGKEVWFSVVPAASDCFFLSFDSDTWGTLKKTKADVTEMKQKFKDYKADPVAAKAKWKAAAVEAAKFTFAFKISVSDSLMTDSAEVLVDSVHACEIAPGLRHKLMSTSSGQSPNQGLAEGATPTNWKLKAKPPTKKGRDADPRVYSVVLPQCEPGTQTLIGKICVFPARQEAFEFTFQTKKLNELSKKLSTTLKMFGDRLKFDVEIGTFFVSGVQGWFEQPDGTMGYHREISGGAKPLAKAELKLKISFLECCTGIPKECWDWLCDVGAYFMIGGSLGASVTYINRYNYNSKATQHEMKGNVTGKFYAGLGLYAKVGPKDIAEVSIEAGAKFGITAQGNVKYVTGGNLGMDANLEIDPVTLVVTIRTKFLWVFGSEHPSEWELTDKWEIWKDTWTLMKFDTPAVA